jgi:hypothetical protein
MMLRQIAVILGFLFTASCSALSPEDRIISSEQYTSIPPNKPLVLIHMIGTDALTFRSEPKFAGAISSLTFRGQEYVNSADHGRLMQGAIAYDGLLECLNPTQAGGSRDTGNLGQRSTSQRLKSYVTLENALHVSTRMAFWFRPGMKCTDQSGPGAAVRNTKRLSDDIYTIEHRFGLNGHPNVASIDISYDIAGHYQSAVVEALTIYTPLAFNTFHSVNLQTGALTLEPTQASDEKLAPIILSTADGAHAIAFVSLQPGATYARFRFPDTNKISLVFRDLDGITGLNSYKAAWVIGTRDEVATQMREILASQ